MTCNTDKGANVPDDDAHVASVDETEDGSGGLLGRLRDRGADLAKGRRLAMTLPGWEDIGDGRGLWARFRPVSRAMQQEFAWAPNAASQEAPIIIPMIVRACEEILIGTAEARTPLALEPEVRALRDPDSPLRFDADLGRIIGVGGSDGAAVVKRMFIRGDDDLPLYGVWGELLSWSTAVYAQSVEVAAGE